MEIFKEEIEKLANKIFEKTMKGDVFLVWFKNKLVLIKSPEKLFYYNTVNEYSRLAKMNIVPPLASIDICDCKGITIEKFVSVLNQ